MYFMSFYTLYNLLFFINQLYTYTAEICQHRFDKRFHQNPPIENRVLREVITKYEKMHLNCYKSVNGDFIKDLIHDHSSIKCKYIIFKIDHSGLGNRVMGILSFYLMALLSNRVLLLYSNEYNINDAFCQPFPYSNWSIPMNFKIENIHHKHDINGFQYAINMHPTDSHRIIYCAGLEQYMIPLYFANKHLQDQLHEWFPTKNLATVLIRYLLHPQNDIWEDIVKSWLIDTRKGNEVTLGIHYRWGYLNLEKSSCLENIPESNVFVYIASMENSTDALINDHINWKAYQRYSEVIEKHTINQVKTAIHDIWLLSLTDYTVISKGSTFGYMIMALKGEPLQFINQGNGGGPIPGYPANHCFTPLSHEPCCHFPIHVLLGINWNETYKNLYTECVDYPGTFKLSLSW